MEVLFFMIASILISWSAISEWKLNNSAPIESKRVKIINKKQEFHLRVFIYFLEVEFLNGERLKIQIPYKTFRDSTIEPDTYGILTYQRNRFKNFEIN